MTLKENSLAICRVSSEPLRIKVYIWLEGCDPDCTQNLCNRTLRKLALSFVGKEVTVNE